jgi:hypothetical protein
MSHVAGATIDDVAAFPTVIVRGPHDPNRFRGAKTENWLRRLALGGTRLGASL